MVESLACPAMMIAGTQSGSGKTTITMGLLAALKRAGYIVQPFKCGPDFIDPTLHQLVTGRVSRNLDLWMCGENFVRHTFAEHCRDVDVAIVEGVMGMFDGGESSSAALAKSLGIPIILIVDVQSAAESVAAVIKGFESFDVDAAPVGVILNRVGSARHLELLTAAIKENCRAEILGQLPRNLSFSMPSRHLGLKMGGEEPISNASLAELAETIKSHIDLDRIIELAKQKVDRPFSDAAVAAMEKKSVRIGVARDKAFCFYYQDNFDLLEAAGAELVFFSPLEDSHLPDGIKGLYLGGGYPELYAQALSANQTMRQEIKTWGESGKPVYAECGGFMYLTKGIIDNQKNFHEMAGIFPVHAAMQNKRSSLGYREVKTKSDFLFGPAGTTLRGHEFHYSTIDEMPGTIEQIYEAKNNSAAGYRYKNVLGGYLHVHFGFSPTAAEEFVKTCEG